jgi:hypothetical protein
LLRAGDDERYTDTVHWRFKETPVERLDKSQSHSFQPVRVQTKDIKDVLLHLDGREGLEIIADDVRYVSAEELIQDRVNTRVQRLSLKIRDPYVSIDLQPTSAWLYTSSSSPEATGLFVTIRQLIRRREAKPRMLYNFYWLFAFALTVPYIFYLPAFSGYKSLSLYVALILAAWTAWAAYVHIKRYSDIYIDDGVSRPGFYTRNKDTILVGIATAVIGAIVGSLLTKALEHPRSLDENPRPSAKSVDHRR